MAIVQNPITGRSSGKFASAIFQTQYGRNILRSAPVTVRNPNTDAQKLVRQKMAAVVAVLKLMLVFLRKVYPASIVKMPSISFASGYAYNNAASGTVDNVVVDPDALLEAPDELGIASLFTADKSVSGAFTITWTGATLEAITGADKNLHVAIINKTTGEVSTSNAEATTADETLTLDVTGDVSGDDFSVYILVDRDVLGFKPGNELSNAVM